MVALEDSVVVLRVVVLRRQPTPLCPHLQRLVLQQHPQRLAEATLAVPARSAQTAKLSLDLPTLSEAARTAS